MSDDHSNTPPESAGATEMVKSPRSHVPLIELELQNVAYTPVVKGDKNSTRKTVLDDISTKIMPGKLTAWMGPSGSGKSSLISVAANLTGDVTGTMLVNKTEGQLPKRLVGVVWQDDLLLSNLTVYENIWYAARLKTPQETPDAEVHALVASTIENLGLSHVQDSRVSGPMQRGISGGERKRVSVAIELVVRPSVLFTDEPTSGLDATTAEALITTLQSLARKGHSVVVVIHQPRTTIFNLFDHLLLLSKGRVIYDGAPKNARDYLESAPTCTPLPPETGIADWIMDVITDDEHAGEQALAQYWSEYADKGSVHGPTKANLEKQMSTLDELQKARKYNVGFRQQLKLLTSRTMKQQRGERLTMTAFMLQVAYLFFTALFWWQIPDNTGGIFERNSLLFFMLIAQANGIVISAVTVFQRERTLLHRERAKKMYGVALYFVGKTLTDMSTNVLMPLVYTMVIYWTAGFRTSATAYLKFILSFYLTFSAAQSMGLWLSIIIPSTQIALVLAPPVTLFFMIMGGFYIPFESMHAGVQWASWLSFARYGYSALVVNEYQGRAIKCSDEVSIGIGGGDCADGAFLMGDEVIESLGITGISDSYWFNIGMVIVLQIVFRAAAYYCLRRTK